MSMFQPAVKHKSHLRLALIGPSGAGKTYTSLSVATHLAGPNGKVAVIDTEHGSAALYADKFAFDLCTLPRFSPQAYADAIAGAAAGGYAVLVIDSISHEWDGPGGVLEMVDDETRRLNGNSFAAWKKGSAEHQRFLQAVLQAPMHVVCTMRSKTEYVVEGKSVKKVGTAPKQRDGIEYEFTVTGDLDHDHALCISKTRCAELDGKVIKLPGKQLADTLLAWLNDGAPAVPPPALPAPPSAAAMAAAQEALTVALEAADSVDALNALALTVARDHPLPAWADLHTWAKNVFGARRAALTRKGGGA